MNTFSFSKSKINPKIKVFQIQREIISTKDAKILIYSFFWGKFTKKTVSVARVSAVYNQR